MNKQTQVLQLLLAAMLLSFGVLVYVFDRPTDQIYFLPEWWQLTTGSGYTFGTLGSHLPTIVHVAAFTLISSALLAPWHFPIGLICLLWFGIDCLLELAQLDAIANRVADMVPDWFEDIPFLENTSYYFMAGTFDIFDIASIALGSIAAYVMILCIQMRERKNDAKN